MKEIILAIDIGHNGSYDTGAVGIRKEDDLNITSPHSSDLWISMFALSS